MEDPNRSEQLDIYELVPATAELVEDMSDEAKAALIALKLHEFFSDDNNEPFEADGRKHLKGFNIDTGEQIELEETITANHLGGYTWRYHLASSNNESDINLAFVTGENTATTVTVFGKGLQDMTKQEKLEKASALVVSVDDYVLYGEDSELSRELHANKAVATESEKELIDLHVNQLEYLLGTYGVKSDDETFAIEGTDRDGVDYIVSLRSDASYKPNGEARVSSSEYMVIFKVASPEQENYWLEVTQNDIGQTLYRLNLGQRFIGVNELPLDEKLSKMTLAVDKIQTEESRKRSQAEGN